MRIRTWHALAVVISVALLLTGCGASSISRPHAKLPGEMATSPCGPLRAGADASNAVLTREFEARLLATFPRLPGATSLASAPIEVLKNAPTTMMSSNFVTATEWWTSAENQVAAEHYIATHLPAGLKENGGETNDFPAADSLFFDHSDTAFAAQIKVLATFAPFDRGVAERVDVQAIYWPRCPNIDALIKNPTGAEVTIERPNKADIRRMINRGRALRLVAVLKTLSPALPVMIDCPADFFHDVDIVSFNTKNGPATVTADMSGCRFLTLTGHPDGTLWDWAGAFDAAVLQAIR